MHTSEGEATVKQFVLAALMVLATLGPTRETGAGELTYSAETVATLLGQQLSAGGAAPAPDSGGIVFYDPGYSIEQMRTLLSGRIEYDAFTKLADGQPWFVSQPLYKQTDAPKYRKVQLIQSSDPNYALMVEDGKFVPSRVVTMLYAIHLLATGGERLTQPTQWTTTSDSAPGLVPDCPWRRVFVAYKGRSGLIIEPFYYGPPMGNPCLAQANGNARCVANGTVQQQNMPCQSCRPR